MSSSNKVRGLFRRFVAARRLILALIAVWGFFMSLENLSGILTYLGWAEAGLIAHYAPPTVVTVVSIGASVWILKIMRPRKGFALTAITVLSLLLFVLGCWQVPAVARLLCATVLGGLLMDLLFTCPLPWLRTALLSVFGSLVAAGVVFSGLHDELISNVHGIQLFVQFVGMWWVVYICYLLINQGAKFSSIEPGEGFKALVSNKVGLGFTFLFALVLQVSIPQAMWGFEFTKVKSTLEGALYCYPMNPRIISPGSLQVLLAYAGLGCGIGNLLSSRRVSPRRVKKAVQPTPPS